MRSVVLAATALWLCLPISAFAQEIQPFDQAANEAERIAKRNAVMAAAEEAEVDPIELMGAVNSVGTDPKEYLYNTGELKRPAPPSPAPRASPNAQEY